MSSDNPHNKQAHSSIPEVIIPETSAISGIRYLTCQGGGMKGIGHVGAIAELEKCGVIAQLEEVAGSSAGGLVALLLAIGCTAKEIRQEMFAVDFHAFQDKAAPGWIESTHIKDLAKGGADLAGSLSEKIDLIKKIPIVGDTVHNMASPYVGHISTIAKASATTHSISDKLEKAEALVGLALGTDLGLWEGEALSYWLSAVVARKTGKPDITFAELAALTEANGSPFKKLTLTGSNITDGVLEYYNASQTPNMSIISAARISASFPGAYKPVIETSNDGQAKVKVDGGLLENLPNVFNAEPYVSRDELTAQGGNPKAFALVFRSPDADKPQKIDTGIDLAKALYAAKMSEKALQQKYGPNIAYIDTEGMGTLEFDAPLSKKLAIEQSGVLGVQNAFKNILKAEQNQTAVHYSKMSLEELIRQEIALQNNLSRDLDPLLAKKQLILIDEEMHNRAPAKPVLATLRERAKNKLFRKKKLLNPKELSDQELSALCQKKRLELERVGKALMAKSKQLKLAKHALAFNRDLIVTRLKENNLRNGFSGELQRLKHFQELLYDNRSQKVVEKNKAKQYLLEAEYQKIKNERAQYIEGIIQNYKASKDYLLQHFFENMQNDILKIDFKVPIQADELHSYCSKYINNCAEFIKKCDVELQGLKQDRSLFDQQKGAFLRRTAKASNFSQLLHLKTALNKSIYRKTTLLIKINQFLIRKAPMFEKIITPFLKAVAFLSFVCWLPLGVPAVSIAKIIGRFSSNTETQTTAERVVNFFQKTDLDIHKRLQGISRTTAQFIKKMSDDYVKADKSEDTYLQKLYAQYMKNSGVALEEIFLKEPHESLMQYKARMGIAENKILRITDPKPVLTQSMPLLYSRGQSRSHQPLKLEDFKLKTNAKVLSTTVKDVEKMEVQESQGIKNEKMNVILKQHQIRSIHLQIIHDVEEKLRLDRELTAKEFSNYIKSAKFLNKELPPTFKERYRVQNPNWERSQSKNEEKRMSEELKDGGKVLQALSIFFKKQKKSGDVKTSKSPDVVSPGKPGPSNKQGR